MSSSLARLGRGSLLAAACAQLSVAHAEVVITGLEDALLDNALIHLGLDDEACDAPQWRVNERYSRAEQQIRTAIQVFGYYSVDMSARLEFGENCWLATFDVALGEPVRLRDVEISISGAAQDDPSFTSVVNRTTLQASEPLQHAAYEQLKRRLLELAQQRGYAEAMFGASRIDVYPLERAADVVLRFSSGPRYTFGEIQFRQDVLEQSFLDGYYEFKRGDPYDRSQLTALYRVLTNSGYFRAVDVRPLEPLADAHEIPVAIELTAANRRAISYGVGFSTDTGPRLRFGRTNRRVNERGAQAGFNGQLSPVISEVGYNYRFPYGDPRTEWVSFDIGVKHEDTQTAVSDTLELGLRRVITRRSSWQETQYIDLVIEDFVVGGLKSRSRLLMPGMSWFKVNADNTLRPDRGFRLGLDVRGANDSLGSDTTFVQTDATAKLVKGFSNRTRLLLRARFGFTWEQAFLELPPSVRFFAGGDNSIRGYEFQSLGPVDANGVVIGGDRLAVASVEYEVPFSSRWSGAMFADSGNAFTGSDFNTKTGAGFGLRWQSPLGPIRIDIAWPVGEIENSPRLHVSLGADL